MLFLLLFIVLPIVEISVFIFAAVKIGIFTTLFLALAMAILGGLIVRHQGFSALIAAQDAFRRNEVPSKELFDGLLIVLAAGLMIVPGFISDILGFLLLIPSVRDFIRSTFTSSMKINIAGFNVDFTEFYETKTHHRPQDQDIIDVSYKTISEQDKS